MGGIKPEEHLVPGLMICVMHPVVQKQFQSTRLDNVSMNSIHEPVHTEMGHFSHFTQIFIIKFDQNSQKQRNDEVELQLFY